MNRRKFLIFCFPLGRVGQGATETFAGLRSLGGSCISTNSSHVLNTVLVRAEVSLPSCFGL